VALVLFVAVSAATAFGFKKHEIPCVI